METFSRVKRKIFKLIIILVVIQPQLAMSDYLATGPYMAESCSGIVFKKCKTVILNAIEYEGRLLKINKRWDSVNDFSNGKCMKKFGGKVWGILDIKPNFMIYDRSGKLVPADIEDTFTFKCRKI